MKTYSLEMLGWCSKSVGTNMPSPQEMLGWCPKSIETSQVDKDTDALETIRKIHAEEERADWNNGSPDCRWDIDDPCWFDKEHWLEEMEYDGDINELYLRGRCSKVIEVEAKDEKEAMLKIEQIHKKEQDQMIKTLHAHCEWEGLFREDLQEVA